MSDLTAETFAAAVDATPKRYRSRPRPRIYHPNHFATLQEDAEAFGIDQSDPQWDILVMSEWAMYRTFERYLMRMGWRP